MVETVAEICVSIGRTSRQRLMDECKSLESQGARLLELRLDWLGRAPDVAALLAGRTAQTVVTVRRPIDGGRWRGDEEQRLQMLRNAVVLGANYIDLEFDVAPSFRRYGKTKRIVSYHNFDGTPDDIEEIYARMCELDADVVKVVTMAHTPLDGPRLLRLCQGAKIPTVAFCMGDFGLPSRVLCARFGAPFTYATFSEERQLAPGQLSFRQMRNVYHFEKINANTEMYGVIGDPIGHSLSPMIHNAALQSAGLNGVYVPLRIPEDQLVPALDAYEKLGIRGLSVTIPHKESILARYPQHSVGVRAIGAANTLYRDSSGAWRCENTDYEAAMAALRSALRPNESLEGKRALVLGAGGAARAIAHGLVQAGCLVVVASRTHARSKRLADELGCRHIGWENRGAEHVDVLVNCTPIGMSPHFNDSPMQPTWLNDGMIVFDTVYNPEQTLLIKSARERGARTVTGQEMFVRQAAAQFLLFTGIPASLDELRTNLKRGLSPVQDLRSDPDESDA